MHARLRVCQAPGIPCALFFRGPMVEASPGRFVPRECDFLFASSLRGAKRRSNPYFSKWRDGLLRGARHRARDPLARNNDRFLEMCIWIEMRISLEGPLFLPHRRPDPLRPHRSVFGITREEDHLGAADQVLEADGAHLRRQAATDAAVAVGAER